MAWLENRKPISEFKTPEEIIAHLDTPEGDIEVPLTGGGSRVVDKELYTQIIEGQTTPGKYISEEIRKELKNALLLKAPVPNTKDDSAQSDSDYAKARSREGA